MDDWKNTWLSFWDIRTCLLRTASAVVAGSYIGFLESHWHSGSCSRHGLCDWAHLRMSYQPAITIAMLVNGRSDQKMQYFICRSVHRCDHRIDAAPCRDDGAPGYSLATNGLDRTVRGSIAGRVLPRIGLIAEIVLTFTFLMVIFGANQQGRSCRLCRYCDRAFLTLSIS